MSSTSSAIVRAATAQAARKRGWSEQQIEQELNETKRDGMEQVAYLVQSLTQP
jgi:hypothetical protein